MPAMLLRAIYPAHSDISKIYTVQSGPPRYADRCCSKSNEVEAKREMREYKGQASMLESTSTLRSGALPSIKCPVPKAHGQSREIHRDVPTGTGVARIKRFPIG